MCLCLGQLVVHDAAHRAQVLELGKRLLEDPECALGVSAAGHTIGEMHRRHRYTERVVGGSAGRSDLLQRRLGLVELALIDQHQRTAESGDGGSDRVTGQLTLLGAALLEGKRIVPLPAVVGAGPEHVEHLGLHQVIAGALKDGESALAVLDT